jgi:teichoic acid transport system ATP-binding protein
MVSHDLVTVAQLAQNVVWLEKGKIKMFGDPAQIIAAYEASGS